MCFFPYITVISVFIILQVQFKHAVKLVFTIGIIFVSQKTVGFLFYFPALSNKNAWSFKHAEKKKTI